MMMNKWTTMKEQMAKPERGRRPFLASECDNLQDAELWRRDIIRETTKSVHLIQNAGAGEHKIRDLNDQINKLLRERTHWDKRILELGGPDYAANAPKSYDADGRELPGGGGYMYFGAAKELPGVRELFHKSDVENPRRTRKDMYKFITPDYYGYRWVCPPAVGASVFYGGHTRRRRCGARQQIACRSGACKPPCACSVLRIRYNAQRSNLPPPAALSTLRDPLSYEIHDEPLYIGTLGANEK